VPSQNYCRAPLAELGLLPPYVEGPVPLKVSTSMDGCSIRGKEAGKRKLRRMEEAALAVSTKFSLRISNGLCRSISQTMPLNGNFSPGDLQGLVFGVAPKLLAD
jgi:hypothetical protein